MPNPELLKRLAIIQENTVPTTVDVVYIAYLSSKHHETILYAQNMSFPLDLFNERTLLENKWALDHGLIITHLFNIATGRIISIVMTVDLISIKFISYSIIYIQ
ncbi:hypothetical protein BCR42DRAFT_399177 [Absidia repens]|uniref:Uncharacterized protein n=1 Tax=Absidia repens TaxID=90262 RepID=A0A1X2HBH8_9FUNG|nr:hypothetical protein BCR42DRAFT_399177 [Absidia repens]